MGLKMNKSTFLGQVRDTGSPEPLGFFLSVVESHLKILEFELFINTVYYVRVLVFPCKCIEMLFF